MTAAMNASPTFDLPQRAWRTLASIRLTIALCFLLTADLGLGYLSLRGNLEIFSPMSDVGLLEWARTYGAANLRHTAWFFAMAGLLALLALNTFACTTQRLIGILACRPPRRELPFRLAPHLMHYAVLIVLVGYLGSYLFAASDPGRALRAGETITLPNGATLRFERFEPETVQDQRIDGFDGFVLRPNAHITARSAEDQEHGRARSTVLNFNEPITVDGYGIYLGEFQPRKPGGGMGRAYVQLIVRRDPAAVIYRFGMVVFVLGLVLHLIRCSRRAP